MPRIVSPARSLAEEVAPAAARPAAPRPGAFGRPPAPETRARCRGLLLYGPAMDDEDGYFGERVAASYDESSAEMFEPGVVDPMVEVLAELAGGGRALELGIGTGRVALPLACRGVPVQGIDLSRAMVARLRAKPGGEDI